MYNFEFNFFFSQLKSVSNSIQLKKQQFWFFFPLLKGADQPQYDIEKTFLMATN